MAINSNAGLKLFMQSAIATAKTITVATNAAPGVFTSTAHGYSNGDIILLEVSGMVEVNNRLFKVVSIATDTFQIAGIDGTVGLDTTAFGTFSGGTAKKVTLGTSITGVEGFSSSGGDIKTVDSTTVNDLVDTQLVIGASAMSYDLSMQWDPANSGQQAMRNAFDVRADRGFKIQWPGGPYVLFYGTVGYTMAPGGEKQGITTSPAKIAMRGPITVYAA